MTKSSLIILMRTFRLDNKKILLTYAQCSRGTAEEFLLEFKWQFQTIINFTYICCCKEDHHETDGQHYHIYFECEPSFKTRNERALDLRFSDGIDPIYYHPNIEVVKKTPWNVVKYVMKDGNYHEYLQENRPKQPLSTLPSRERNKLLNTTDPLKLLNDGDISPIQCANLMKAKQYIQSQMSFMIEKEKPTVLWFYGPTGTGKTRTAVEMAEQAVGKNGYWKSCAGSLQWFDGYTGQEYVIIDDFRRGMCTFEFFLNILDRYIIRVPIKGGYVNWVPKVIIITSPVPPKEAWQYFDKDKELQDWDHIEQLLRRIDEVREFN